MRELSVFIDESGSDGLKDKYYLVTLVLHEQSDDISEGIRLYEQSLSEKGLPDIPLGRDRKGQLCMVAPSPGSGKQVLPRLPH